VASYPGCGEQWAALESDAGALTGAAATPNPSPLDTPDSAAFPWCFHGARVTITLTLPDGADPTGWVARGPTDDEGARWYAFDRDADTGLGAEIDGAKVHIAIEDGGAGDHDRLANGEVTHLGGPVVVGHRLAVAVEGPGSVTSDPGGIDCGSDCEEEIRDGASVTLTAYPEDGAIFTGWRGHESCAGQPECQLVVDEDATLVAAFEKSDKPGPPGDDNDAPTAPVLVSPENGATGVPVDTELSWQPSTDPDGDAVSYRVDVCARADFEGCEPIEITWLQTLGRALANRGGAAPAPLAAGIVGFALFGLGRRRARSALLVAMVLCLAAVSACDKKSSPDEEPEGVVATTMSALEPGTTYHWRVTAKDGKGGEATSETWSFTTK
jgi:hypothetical protein